MFEPGEKVVCVDASGPRHGNRILSVVCTLAEGKIYTISGFVPPYNGILIDGELPHVVEGYALRGGWSGDRFRKLRTNESEAREQWQNMLTNPIQVDA